MKSGRGSTRCKTQVAVTVNCPPSPLPNCCFCRMAEPILTCVEHCVLTSLLDSGIGPLGIYTVRMGEERVSTDRVFQIFK